ncbi:trypsin-like cysteine/serine peptidase domain-containing protein, partial [Ochromonadaceae sp. CCMP2298]
DSTSGGSRALSRNFVADAVAEVAPAVVNIMCAVDGFMMSGISSGSGFVLTDDGFVVTNAHVVVASSDGRVVCTMMDGKKVAGTVHSLDLLADIALVKLDASYTGKRYATARVGSSSKVRVGEFVVAIGSPLSLQNSASFGIVSATARHASELGLANNRAEYIQTDAGINSGNSGGPLVNLDGEVIGICSMKLKNSDGISFAIPMDAAMQVINQLMSNKKVVRPYVGITLVNFASAAKTKSKKSLLQTREVQVRVSNVAKGSPANLCGIRSGDIIKEVDGKVVAGVRDVLGAVGFVVGRTIEFKIHRDSNDIKVRLTTAP